MYALFWLLVNAAVLWFVIVWVMQDHNFGWGSCILWIIVSTAASWGSAILLSSALGPDPGNSVRLIPPIIFVAVLGTFVWFRFSHKGPSKVALVMAIFLAIEFIKDLIS